MNRRSLKYHVAAALVSAAFCFEGMSTVSAYTYNNIKDDIVNDMFGNWDAMLLSEYDESDLVITNKSNITDTESVNAKKYNVGNELKEKHGKSYDSYYEGQVYVHSFDKMECEDLSKFYNGLKYLDQPFGF